MADALIRRDAQGDNILLDPGFGLDWAGRHRARLFQLVGALLLLVIVGVIASLLISRRADKARTAFGEAMEVYQRQVQTAGQPPIPGEKTFPSAKERAVAANKLFLAVADQYGSTASGKNARFFAGITELEAGDNTGAEATLKQVAGGWDKQLGSLAKFSLADLYRSTGRDAQAIELYNQLTDKPTDAVSGGEAQLQLAELYESEGKTDLAHKIYAQLKDKDAKGTAGTIAAQKLAPSSASGGGLPPL